MRLLTLHLRAFGPFTNVALPVGREGVGEPGLTIVYGPNEAGKSTALRAVRQLFFGIDGDRDAYRTAKHALRLGGVVQDRAGVVHEFLRRGRGTKTLYKLDDKSKLEDEEFLETLLDSIDATTYETRFGLHHEDLEAGAKAVLESSGSLNSALFAATAKTKSLQKLRDELLGRAEKLFKPQATTGTKVTLRLGEYRKLNEEATRKEDAGEVGIYRALCGEIERREADLATHRAERANLAQRARRLQRFAELYAPHRKRAAYERELAELADIPVPREDFEPRRRKIEGERIALRERLARARRALDENAEETVRLGAPCPLLAHAVEIERLSQEANFIAGERQRAEALSQERGLAAIEVERSLRRFGDTIAEIDLEGLDLPESYAADVRALIDERNRLAQKREGEETRRTAMRSRQQELSTSDEPAGADAAIARLDDALLRARLAAESMAERDRLAAEVRAHAAEAVDWIARRFVRSIDPSELRTLPVPSAESIEEEGVSRERLAAAEAQAATEFDQLRVRLVELEGELRRDEVQGLPSADDLRQSRTARDEVLKALTERLLVREDDGGLFEAARVVAIRTEIARVVEAVTEADRIADALRRDAARVAQLEQARREERSAREKLAALEARSKERREERARADELWRERWSAIGVRAESPKAMQGWRREWERIVVAARENAERSRRLEELTDRAGSALRTLLEELAVPVDGASLADSLASGERRKRSLEAERAKSIDRQGERTRLVEHLAAVETAISRLDEQLRDWTARWERKLASLPTSPGGAPDEMLGFLDRLADWRRRRDELSRIDREVASIERRRKNFQGEVAATAGQLDLGESTASATFDAPARVRRWIATLAEERRREDERRRLRQDQEKAKAEIAAAQERDAVLAQELGDICRAVGLDASADLAARLETVARKRRTQEAAAELDDFLAQRFPDSTWEALGSELAAWTPETLDSAVAAAEEESAQIASQIEDLERRLGEACQKRDADWTGDSKAADLAQAKQRHLAEIATNAERYAVYRLALAGLERSIERYREKHKSPILDRARRFFATLTGGAFSGLEPDGEAEGIAVVGIRDEAAPEPHQVPVSGMSRGTCDQLYLAFRMALWEERLEKASPIPIMLDDVLVHFDDERAAAALRAFDELAKRTQIVYFTHHRHLVDLARKTLPADRLTIQELPTHSG